MAKGTAAPLTTITLMKGTLKLMAWTKAKTTIVVAAVLASLVATPLAVHHYSQTREITLPDHLSKDSLVNKGYQTPGAALETVLWAMSRADCDRLMDSATPEQRARMENDLKATSRDAFVARMQRNSVPVTGFKITGHKTISPGVIVIDVRTEGVDKFDEWTFRKIGDEWKFEFE